MNCYKWYIHFLVKHPYILLLVIAAISCACLIAPFTLENMNSFDFQDPQAGFSTRSTIIADRLTAWENLQREVRFSGSLVKNPKEFLIGKEMSRTTFKPRTRKPKGKQKGKMKETPGTTPKTDIHEQQNGLQDQSTDKTVYGKIILNEITSTGQPEIRNKWRTLKKLDAPKPHHKPKSFCGGPEENYVHLVIKANNGNDLFTWENLKLLCRLENFIMNLNIVPDICISDTEIDGECCKPWSLPNYIAALFDKHSCLSITEADVNKTKSILEECAIHFHNNKLRDCRFCTIPAHCQKHDAVFTIFNYLITASDNQLQKLEETLLFLPIAASTASKPLFNEFERLGTEFEGLSIVAMEFGIKSAIFDEYLLKDARLMGLGAFFVFVCLWVYTASIFVTVMTIMSVFIVLTATYFLYQVVYAVNFFPFMNMLSVIICIGLGADNAFILCKIFSSKKLEMTDNKDLYKIMYGTFEHSFKTMFVTSLTTAVAFWSSYTSSVTVISCFSIFTGTAIILNFVLSVSWIPACLIVREQPCCNSKKLACFIPTISKLCCFKGKWTMILGNFLVRIWNNKGEWIINAVIKLRYLWITCFSALAVASVVVVFIKPGLVLPNSLDIQLFRIGHPFEKYDFIYKSKFLFQKQKSDKSLNDNNMPLRFVWGVVPVDNGDHLDPENLGSLKLDEKFDISDPESQIWMMNFCKNVKLQSFYKPTYLSQTRCFIESFVESMKRPCNNSFIYKDLRPCCAEATFPFNRSVFSKCVIDDVGEVYRSPALVTYPRTAGAIFSKEDLPKIKAVVIEFDSSESFSMDYTKINKFYNDVNEWTNLQLLTAPPNMKDGFFISELGYYDLQRELNKGTQLAIVVSTLLTSAILVACTLNIVLTIIATVTITFTILTTIAGLVLYGWTLNIVESITISTAIGLAVDFALHYSISYKLCPAHLSNNREDATRFALSSLMSPSFMAALTTAGAGFFMLFSSVLAYFQIGLFLLSIMCVSWLYATLFMGSLLVTIGPTQNCCQYSSKKVLRLFHCGNKPLRQKNDTVITSTSSTTELDRISFINHDTPMPIKKKASFKEPLVRYTSNQGIADQSPSSNVTIITAEE
ncbi:hypothetical protein HUJ05_002808 [Dendroctonus ponderosae]|nr:hypothetical protein HUJ05_002808 [Dendroctonus ponderosae]